MTTTTVIGTIESAKAAQALVNELVQAGLSRQDVEVIEGATEKEIVATIVGRGFGEGDARGYAKAASGGKTLVLASAPEGKVDQAVAIVERHEAAGNGEGARTEAGTLQEVREELTVGTRKVATGGVRVTSSVSEAPVEQTVTLREEEVSAERTPASRTLSAEEADAAFQGRTVEALGTREEAEVSKVARVVGEVSIGKQTKEREETVRDTVRRTEVDVEQIAAKAHKPK